MKNIVSFKEFWRILRLGPCLLAMLITAFLMSVLTTYVARAADVLSVALSWDRLPDTDIAYYNLRWFNTNQPGIGYVRQVVGTNSLISFPVGGAWSLSVSAVNTEGLEGLGSTNLLLKFPGPVPSVRFVAVSQTTITNWIINP